MEWLIPFGIWLVDLWIALKARNTALFVVSVFMIDICAYQFAKAVLGL